MLTDAALQEKYAALLPHLSERLARLYLASEAQSMGRGGKQKVAKLAGVSRMRIDKGIIELAAGTKTENAEKNEKIRKSGSGRKRHKESQAGLLEALEAIVNPHVRADPMKPLLWTGKSLRYIEKMLKEKGYVVSYVTISDLLKSLGYGMQRSKKTIKGGDAPNRNEQFEYINKTVLSFMTSNAPVISIDCKKKELTANHKNGENSLKESFSKTDIYDLLDKGQGKITPHGGYYIPQNQGWVNAGTGGDIAEFAVNTIRTWWQLMGRERYPEAKKLLITADGGGRLWKRELYRLATEIGIEITVCHFPAGTSKWNKIEHRLFSHTTKNWRNKPLESLGVVVNLIANTIPHKGLKVKTHPDKKHLEKGPKISDGELQDIKLTKSSFRGDWNYTICL